MKKIIYKMLLVTFVTAMTAACNDKMADSSAESGSRDVLDSVQLVLTPYAVASGDIGRFKSIQDTVLKYANQPQLGTATAITAYTIRAIDMLAAMGLPSNLVNSKECKYKYARVYLAVDSLLKFKLYILPVQGANLTDSIGGTDIYLNSKGKYKNPATQDGDSDKYMLDLNAPCPSTCADNPPSPIVKK
jgi:hypothetical protein